MSKSKLLVGRSSRTPIKHFLLNAIVGKIAGVLSTHKLPCRANPFYCVDLCGGDGLETDEHAASPLILHKHCVFVRNKIGKESILDVLEKRANTFEQLDRNTRGLAGRGTWFNIRLEDSSRFVLPQLKSDQCAFVHCDPNHVHDMPLTDPLVASWNRYTTYLVTLGCNVSGLKCLPYAQREGWFQYPEMLVRALPRHHDAILFWLNRDAAQWAYLLSLPLKWSDEFKTWACNKAGKQWSKGVFARSYRREPLEFHDQIRKLFLTKEEYDA